MGKAGQQDKSFTIPKQLVWEAYRRVKANKGAAGVDCVSMEGFEEDLRAWRDEDSGSAHCGRQNRADGGGPETGGPDGIDFPS